MPLVLAATKYGCRVFDGSAEADVELENRPIAALAPEPDGTCVAVVEGRELWRRSADGTWSRVATAPANLESVLVADHTIYCGALEGAELFRCVDAAAPERLEGFDNVPGRDEWHAGGPPLSVRSLTATADGHALMAAVHVGGIARSTDRGQTWTPTIPIEFDVHEVRAHRSLPVVAAAAAVGLCVSHDDGENWKVLADGLDPAYSLAVALLEDEVLFSVQDGPFPDRSQIWRWNIAIDENRLEQVRDGLPRFLEGKVDSAHLAAHDGRTALIDGGGNLWLSSNGSRDWQRIADDLQHAYGVVLLD